VKCLHISM